MQLPWLVLLVVCVIALFIWFHMNSSGKMTDRQRIKFAAKTMATNERGIFEQAYEKRFGTDALKKRELIDRAFAEYKEEGDEFNMGIYPWLRSYVERHTYDPSTGFHSPPD